MRKVSMEERRKHACDTCDDMVLYQRAKQNKEKNIRKFTRAICPHPHCPYFDCTDPEDSFLHYLEELGVTEENEFTDFDKNM